MSVIRVEKTNNYTVIGNYHLQDKRLSLKAKGLLSVVLSLPENWDYSISGLSSITKEGRDSIRSVIKELEDYGYLIRRNVRNDKGQYENEYVFYEKSTESDSPSRVDRVGLSDTDKSTQLNTNNKNTNKSNTNKLNTKEYILDLSEIAINYLNEKANRKFRLTKENSKLVDKLLSPKKDAKGNKYQYTIDDIKYVIDNKVNQWGNDERMANYLQPSTLFRESNFERYIQEKPQKRKGGLSVEDIMNL